MSKRAAARRLRIGFATLERLLSAEREQSLEVLVRGPALHQLKPLERGADLIVAARPGTGPS